ncbi:MAG: GNAT family N-acetyltransferase [Clostridiales bacterium]|nr:GNAT family N-acetyltransferase [Clostridiales bacterium]
MNIKIRDMNESHREEVISMMKTFYSSSAVYTEGSEDIFINDFNSCVSEGPYSEGFIFEEGKVVCGYGMVSKSFSTEFGKPCIWIEDIYIKEGFRGKGIGKEYFDFLGRKYTGVIFRLEVQEENSAAIHLYKKEGFDILPYTEMKKIN